LYVGDSCRVHQVWSVPRVTCLTRTRRTTTTEDVYFVTWLVILSVLYTSQDLVGNSNGYTGKELTMIGKNVAF